MEEGIAPTQPQRSSKKLFGVVVLNAVITLSEFIGGIMSGSLSLVSDAFHNLSDTLAIIFSYGREPVQLLQLLLLPFQQLVQSRLFSLRLLLV